MLPYYEHVQTDFKILLHHNEFCRYLHFHPHAQILYVLNGQVELSVGKDVATLHEGDFAIMFPHIAHHIRRYEDTVSLDILFTPNAINACALRLHRMYPTNPILRKEQISPSIHRLFHELAEEFEGGDVQPAVLFSYLQILLLRLFDKMTFEPVLTPKQPDAFTRVISYISEKYAEPLTLEFLAGELNISTYHLSHLLSKNLHMNFRTYLNHLRIHHAKYLLLHSDLPITEIMYQCGFQTQRTFYRAFDAEVGISPVAFRQQAYLADNRTGSIEKRT